MMISSHALLLAGIPAKRVLKRMRAAQANRYALLQELYRSDDPVAGSADEIPTPERLHSLEIDEGAAIIGARLDALDTAGCRLTTLVRAGERNNAPAGATTVEAGDILVLFGPPELLDQARISLLRRSTTGPV